MNSHKTPNVDVVVLCGGMGTRLSSVSGGRPKPMMLINGKPFLEIIVDHYVRHGYRRFIFCVGYKANVIQEYFNSRNDIEATFSREVEPAGTAGAIKLSERFWSGEAALVLNGDSFFGIDPRELITFHMRHKGDFSMALATRCDRLDVGAVRIDEKNRLTEFSEKEYDESLYMNSGVYVVDKRVLDRIKPNVFCSLEREVLPNLVKEGVYGKVFDVVVSDIGTPERLDMFKRKWNAAKV